jgi:hypothetical protein
MTQQETRPNEKHLFVNDGPDPLLYLTITAPHRVPEDSHY